MVHPEVDTPENASAQGGFRGVYPLTEQLRNRGFSSRTFANAATEILAGIRTVTETLTPQIITRHRLMGLHEALTAIHSPQTPQQLEQARFRLKFEELFYLQLDIQRYARRRNRGHQGLSPHRTFFQHLLLPVSALPATGAQKRVIKEIRADMATGRQMNRLLQGDVGPARPLWLCSACS